MPATDGYGGRGAFLTNNERRMTMAMPADAIERLVALEQKWLQTATEAGVLRRDMATGFEGVNRRIFWLTVGTILIGVAALVLAIVAISGVGLVLSRVL